MIDLGNRELEKLVENCIASKKVHGIQTCRLDTNIGALCVDCISNGDCEICKRYFQTGSEIVTMRDTKLIVDTIAELQEKITDQIKTIRWLMEDNESMTYKLERIVELVNDYDGTTPSMIKQFSEIQKVLEKE